MRITVDLDLSKAVVGRGTSQLITSLDEKRATMAVLEVEFIRQNVIQDLPLDATGQFELKNVGDYDMEPLTGASAWTKFGTGTSTYYRLAYALINDPLDALFGVDLVAPFTTTFATDLFNATAHGLVAGNTVQFSSDDTLPAPLQTGVDYYVIATGLTANAFQVSATLGGSAVNLTNDGTGTHTFVCVSDDIPSIQLMGEVSWRFTSQDYKTQTILFNIANDVNRDADTIPPSPAIIYVRDSFIRHGSGVPSDAVGVDGDAYINDDNGDLYFRDAGVYVLDFNLNGSDSGFSYKFNSATTGDPGNGKFLFNHATFASATLFHVSETDNDSNSLATFLTKQDDSTSANKCLVIARKNDGTPYFSFYITAVLTDAGGYDTFAITPISTGGSIANDDLFRLTFLRIGDKGDTGREAALQYLWNTSTSNADPGSGKVSANTGTMASIVSLYVNETDNDANALAALLATWDDGTSTIKGRLTIHSPATPTIFLILDITARTDNGAWDTFTVVFVASGGTLTNDMPVTLAFVPKGDVGVTGYDSASTIPAGTSGVDIDLATVSMSTARVLTANTSFDLVNPVNGKVSIVHIKQAAANSYTTSFPDVDFWMGTGGMAPTQSAGFDVIDTYTFWYDGVNIYGSWAAGQ